MNRTLLTAATSVAALVGLLLLAGERPAEAPRPGTYPFVFTDVGDEAGLFPHAATSAATGPPGATWTATAGSTCTSPPSTAAAASPTSSSATRRASSSPTPRRPSPSPRAAPACVFADLDNDGDLDLYVGNMPDPKNKHAGCALFRNDGKGKFTDVSKDSGACPPAFGGRSVTRARLRRRRPARPARRRGPASPATTARRRSSSRLFRNKGNLQVRGRDRRRRPPRRSSPAWAWRPPT